MEPVGSERDRELEEVGVVEPERVVGTATAVLHTNLQRAVDAYNRRAEALTEQIDAATSEREDVLKARDAAALALEALVGGVMEAAVAEELG